MRKLFAYKGVAKAEESIYKAAERGEAYYAALVKICIAIVRAPINVHVKYIEFRLRMTDKFLEEKAKSCERLLKEMSVKRKKLAKEQYEARHELKAVRTNFAYPGNPRIID